MLVKVYGLLPKVKANAFIGLFVGILAVPPMLLPAAGIPANTPLPVSHKGYVEFIEKHRHGLAWHVLFQDTAASILYLAAVANMPTESRGQFMGWVKQ